MNELDIIELDFITRISKTMEARGMTATALARKAKVSHSGVFRVLSGAVGLSFERAYQLADALGLEFYPMLQAKKGGPKLKRAKAITPWKKRTSKAKVKQSIRKDKDET